MGVRGREASEWEAQFFARGVAVEDWFAALLAEKYPDLRRQVEITLPEYDASGHIDFYIPSLGRILEVKTAAVGVPLDDLPKREHVLQAQAYLHFFREAEEAELVYIILGAGLVWRSFPVRRDEALGRSIEAALGELHRRAREGRPPEPPYRPWEFPCRWKSRWAAHYVECPYHGLCHPPREEAKPKAEAQSDVRALAERWLSLQAERSRAKDDLERVLAELREVEAALGALLPEAGVYDLGDLVVRRQDVAPRTAYDLQAAIRAGAVDPMALEPFRKEVGGYTRWAVARH
jgi:hypothetical protein